MADLIETYLKDHGPAMSSDIVTHLIEHLGISPPAARQRVSRAAGNVRRLKGLDLPHKTRFLYLEQQFGSPWYWENLISALNQTRSAHGYALAALRQRGGIVTAREFPIICGSPLLQSRQVPASAIAQILCDIGLLKKFWIPGSGECIGLTQASDRYEVLADSMRALRVTETILLAAVKDWLKNLGIASYGKVATRADAKLPQVGTFVWDLTAPSYLGHMVQQSADGKVKPGFVACDVCLGHDITAEGVRPFIRKCVMLRNLHKVGPCMQILIADRFDGEAFQLLKQNGIIPATPANLFGEEIAKGLRQLTAFLEGAARAAIDPDRFDELFDRLGKIEGAAIQLRGTLFEFLAADLARSLIGQQVIMNRMFKTPGGEAEADIVAVDGQRAITLIECKGYNPNTIVPDDEFKRWLQHNVAICFKALNDHPDWRRLDKRFEFWTTASLSKESMALFEQASQSIKATRYTLGLRLGAKLHADCKATRDPNLRRAFEKHFMTWDRKPLSKVEQEDLFIPFRPDDRRIGLAAVPALDGAWGEE